jgi:hypothetical protein
MKYSIEIGSTGMTYIPSFIKIDSGTEEIRLLQQQFERLQCWCCRREGFMNYAIQMSQVQDIYVKFQEDRFRSSKVVKGRRR